MISLNNFVEYLQNNCKDVNNEKKEIATKNIRNIFADKVDPLSIDRAVETILRVNNDGICSRVTLNNKIPDIPDTWTKEGLYVGNNYKFLFIGSGFNSSENQLIYYIRQKCCNTNGYTESIKYADTAIYNNLDETLLDFSESTSDTSVAIIIIDKKYLYKSENMSDYINYLKEKCSVFLDKLIKIEIIFTCSSNNNRYKFAKLVDYNNISMWLTEFL